MKIKAEGLLVKIFNNPIGRKFLNVPKGKKIYLITKSSAHYYTGEIAKNGRPIICTGALLPGSRLPIIHWLENWKPIPLCWLFNMMGWKIPKYFIGADTGAKSPGTMADLDMGEGIAWSNVNNAKVSDGSYATIALSGDFLADSLEATDFAFGVPVGATINGIMAEVKSKTSASSETVYFAIYAYDGVTEVQTDKSATITTTDEYVVRGSSTDLWASTWTAGVFSDAAFSFSVAPQYGTNTLSVDHIRLTIYYTVNAPTVTTQDITTKATTSGLGNGTIVSTGGANATRRGFCYLQGDSGDPTTANSVAYDDGDFSAGAFTKSITGLSPGTAYRIRAYAVNSVGTSYGTTVDYTTKLASDQTAGPLSPGTMADDATVGTLAWSNPDNAKVSDNTYVTAVQNAQVTTHYLKATNFGFAIPTGAIISGIKVEVERKNNGNPVYDFAVRIVKGGAIGTRDKSIVAYWSTVEGYVTYGSTEDLWGETFTPAQINASDFGFVMSAHNDASFARTASVDHIRITVYYSMTIPTPTDLQSKGNIAVRKHMKGSNSEIPPGTDELTEFTAQEYLDATLDDNAFVENLAEDNYGLFLFKRQNANSVGSFSINWVGKAEVAPSSYPLYLQLYNRANSVWDDIANNAAASADEKVTLSGSKGFGASAYYATDNNIIARIYQQQSAEIYYFENFPGRDACVARQPGNSKYVSFHAINLPVSFNLNKLMLGVVNGSLASSLSTGRSVTVRLGVYSLNGGTLSIANSASATFTFSASIGNTFWLSLATSASQVLSAGEWFIGFQESINGNTSVYFLQNDNIYGNPVFPGIFTAGYYNPGTTSALPVTINTSANITLGTFGAYIPYIIFTS